MVRRREPKAIVLKTAKLEPTTEEIETFAAGADVIESSKVKELNPSAIHDFKAMRVPFNEYEYEQLVKGAEISGRSKLNFMRYAMLMLVKDLQK